MCQRHDFPSKRAFYCPYYDNLDLKLTYAGTLLASSKDLFLLCIEIRYEG